METCESLPLAREAFSKVGIDKVDCSAAWEKDVCVGGVRGGANVDRRFE